MSKVMVVGAGIAGLTAALRAHQCGHDVTLISMGVGGFQLSQGSVDVLGPESRQYEDPFALMERLGDDHPYQVIGADRTREAISYFTSLVPWITRAGAYDAQRPAREADRITVNALPQTNMLLPTAIGAMRPTYLAPISMVAGNLAAGARFTIVGIREYKDLYPELICGNLNRQILPDGGRIYAQPRWISFPARDGEADSSSVMLAKRLDDAKARRALAEQLKRVLPEDDSVVGLPAVLGYADPAAHGDLQNLVGRRIFEIPSLPPSMPGIRINNHLIQLAKDKRIRIINGSRIIGAQCSNGRVEYLIGESAGRKRQYQADAYIYCPGGFESFGLTLDSYGRVFEPVFNLPLRGAEDTENLIHADWYTPQPLFQVGVAVDKEMRPLDTQGEPVFTNLRVAGAILAGATRWTEKSGEGIALGSAVAAADSVEV